MSDSRKDRRTRKALARRATRQAVRQARREGGTMHDARRLMREKLAEITIDHQRESVTQSADRQQRAIAVHRDRQQEP